MRWILSVVAVLVCAASSVFGADRPASVEDRIVHDLCGKSVALLGESPLHGFGKTLEVKVALVERLVDECHYNALFIESGIYDFLNIEKRAESGQDVTEGMIAAAIGGLWATREVEPLIPFLLRKVKTRQLTLGGLDDQIGRGTYAQREMPADLVQHLANPDEKARCTAILRRHTEWQYTESSPYSAKDRDLIVGCLSGVESALSESRSGDKAAIASLKRLFARDFAPDPAAGVDRRVRDGNERDRSMYLNFSWLMGRLPAGSKAIVWAATNHVAKDLTGVSGDRGAIPFGSYVRTDLKNRAFALGFSAYSGAYAMTRQPVRQLSAAPADALEATCFSGRESESLAYLSTRQLRDLGPISARPLGADFKTAKWDDVVDGMVVFREERPPEFIRR